MRRNLYYAARFFSQSRPHPSENLPSIGPRVNIDIKSIRQNPELYSKNCVERKYHAQKDHPSTIIKLFNTWYRSRVDSDKRREQSNDCQRLISTAQFNEEGAVGTGDDAPSREDLIEQARRLKQGLEVTEDCEADLISRIEVLAAELPNLTSQETPRLEARTLYPGDKSRKPTSLPSGATRDHVRIGQTLDLLDFSAAATTSGWGWYYLKNEAGLLELALVNYAISVARKHGFSIVIPPSMVYSHIASASGFQPRDQGGEQQVYEIQQSDGDHRTDQPGHSLTATAEIPFASMKANEILKRSALPIKVVGSSRCFRAEAGARGRATKGLYRVHEFTKVEMFAWTEPGKETETFDSMLQVQKEILDGLGLYFKVLEMPATDLGASAFRKQDIEVFFPSRHRTNEGWGEVTSASICTDYQTRRLNTRLKGLNYPSTVNGTAMAVPRVLAALLEYYCEEKNGSTVVRVPEVLKPWMHGVDIIERKDLSTTREEK